MTGTRSTWATSTDWYHLSLLFIKTIEEDLEREFGKYGKVLNVNLKVKDPATFAFIAYETEQEVDSAIQG